MTTRTVYYLYQYHNRINDKKYLGVTIDINRRRYEHAHKHNSSRLFSKAVDKYGIDSFEFKVLAILNDMEEAARTEQAAIIKFNSLAPYGYNLRAGAPFTIYSGRITEETKRKLSEINMGKRPSAETRAKLSAARLGKKRPPDVGKKVGDSQRGITRSAETRAKLSKAGKGRKAWNKGIPMSSESKERVSASKKGIPWSLARRVAEENRKKKQEESCVQLEQ